MAVSSTDMILLVVKAIIVSIAWTLELKALKTYYISSLEPINSIKIVVVFIAGILIFNESLHWWNFIGAAIILVGLLLLNRYDKKSFSRAIISQKQAKISSQSSIILKSQLKLDRQRNLATIQGEKTQYRLKLENSYKKKRVTAVICFVVACLLHATSAIQDKFIMQNISTNQMQFWFMLFSAILLWIFFFIICIKEKKMLVKEKRLEKLAYLYSSSDAHCCRQIHVYCTGTT